MKLIQNTAIGLCLFTSIAVQAQQTSDDTTTKFTPPIIVKNADTVLKSENTIKEYRSKQWHQGDEMITDEKNGAVDKPVLLKPKRSGKQHGAPPPPPALPSAPPPPSVKP